MMTSSSSARQDQHTRQDPYVGRCLANRYRLNHLIGRGSMGRVYAAEDMLLGDVPVAVKLLSHAALDEISRARFEREAKACAQLGQRSLNIVRVSDYGITLQDVPFYVMELLNGESLRDLISSQPLPLPRFFHLARQICLGLSQAHEGIFMDGQMHPIIHRDLKPSNILVVQNEGLGELVKILDFGIAKFLTDQSTTSLQTQSYIGTLAYSAPEQMESEELSVQSDLYSLGVIFYTMLSGRMPFRVKTHSFAGWYRAHCQQPPRSFASLKANVLVPAALEGLIMRCLSKSPAERPRSAAEVYEVLLSCEQMCSSLLPPAPLQPSNPTEGVAAVGSPPAETDGTEVVDDLSPPTVLQRLEADAHRSESLPSTRRLSPLSEEQEPSIWSPHPYMTAAEGAQSSLPGNASENSMQSLPLSAGWEYATLIQPDPRALEPSPQQGRRLSSLRRSWLRLSQAWEHVPAPMRLRALPGAAIAAGSLLALTIGMALSEDSPSLASRLASNPLVLDPVLPTLSQQPNSTAIEVELLLPLLEPDGSSQPTSSQLPAIATSAPPLPVGAQALMDYALARLAQDDQGGAATACQMLISQGPSGTASQACQSYLQWRSGDAEQALTTASTLVATDPRQPLPYFYRGLAEASLRQWAQAESDFSRMLALKPKYGPAYQGRALARLRQEQLALALGDCQKAIQFTPQLTSAYNTCGNIKAAMGDRVGALADYSSAIGRDNRQSAFWVNRGLTYLAQQNVAQAAADLTQALRLQPAGEVAAAAYYGQAQLKIANQDFAGARADLELAQVASSLQEGDLPAKIAELLEMLDQ